jgi:hypothetical protein
LSVLVLTAVLLLGAAVLLLGAAAAGIHRWAERKATDADLERKATDAYLDRALFDAARAERRDTSSRLSRV